MSTRSSAAAECGWLSAAVSECGVWAVSEQHLHVAVGQRGAHHLGVGLEQRGRLVGHVVVHHLALVVALELVVAGRHSGRWAGQFNSEHMCTIWRLAVDDPTPMSRLLL